MSFTEVIKNQVLEQVTASNLTTFSIVFHLGVAALLGLYIYFVYRATSKSGFYNRDFNKSLASLPVITAGIMLAMQSNLIISLGMVGALSIVRFRNAVKDSSDLTYLFWSISMGIVAGVGLYELAVIISLALTVLWLALDLLPNVRQPYLLVVSGDQTAKEAALLEQVKLFAPKARVRSRNLTQRGTEWIVELQVKNPQGLIQAVSATAGISSVNLLTHDGEVRF